MTNSTTKTASENTLRLDKFLAENTGLTRSQANKALKAKRVTCNGECVKDGALKISARDAICLDDELIPWIESGLYFLFYKPEGVICSRDDGDYPTVFEFFEPQLAAKLHCAGRLDVDTTGLVLLTDDGQWSHRVTAPKHHCEKTYLVTLADPIEANYVEAIAAGLMLRGEKTPTNPAQFEPLDDYNGNLTLSEGRYHQVKRMFAALGNKVVGLHRWQVGDIVLDDNLNEGDYRALTPHEINQF